MKKLGLFSIILGSLFLFGCTITFEDNNSNNTPLNKDSDTIVSKNVECQKLLHDFKTIILKRKMLIMNILIMVYFIVL